jgi:ABC-type transport system involved in multi-copper enzyme maturation permease subunit
MIALLLRLWRQHRVTLFVMCAGLAGFMLILTRVAPAPGEVGFLATVATMVPKQLLAMAGGDLAFASARGVIAFGYVHPFFLTMLSAWTIRVTVSALAGELGRGTMDLLAARPLPRWAHVLAAWIASVAGLAVLVLAAWTGTAIGLQLRALEVSAGDIAPIPLMAWLLFASWAGISLAISASRREAGPAISWAAGIIAFAYFRPQEIAGSGIAVKDVVTLAVLGISSAILAVTVFRRRDL